MVKGSRKAGRQPTERVWARIYLREWRKRDRLSVEALGARAGVSPAQISLIENKKSAGSPETLEKLAKALNISVGQLFDEPPEPGEVVVRARIKQGQEDQWAKLLNLIEGTPLTKT